MFRYTLTGMEHDGTTDQTEGTATAASRRARRGGRASRVRRASPGGRGFRRVTAARALALAFAVCSLAAACLAAPAAPPAGAEPGESISGLQAEADRVRAEVARLDRQAQVSVERYNMARAELDELNARLTETRRALERAEQQLDAAQAQLGERVTQIYKSDGIGLLDVLLSTSDFAELGTQLDFFRLINEADERSVDGIERLAADAADLEARIEDDRAAALERELTLREKQADIEDQLAARRALLDDLDARVKELIERQARRDAAAARRLAAAAGIDIEDLKGTPAQVAVIRETVKYLGIPYVWGGESPTGGFDCSGLVMYVYAKFGVSFPHGATMQAHMGTPVPLDRLQPADLVFFGSPSFYHHVGIYVGGGIFIEAPRTGDVVKFSVLEGRGCTLACRYPIRLP